MTDSDPVEAKQAKLLDAIRACGDGWHNRKTIAEAMGKSKLGPDFVLLLEMLTRDGGVEMRTVERSGPIGYEYQYRLPQQ